MVSGIRGIPIPTLLVVLLIGWSLAAGPASAAHLVGGTVREAASGEGLVAATIQIEGTFRGTIANEVGEYALEIPQLPATLRITHIGYHSQIIEITDSAMTRVDVALQVSPHRLPEIVVYPELGADLMRKVIQHKATWMPRIQSYQAEAYTRRSIDRTGEKIGRASCRERV